MFASSLLAVAAQAGAGPVIDISDVTLFYKLYDMTGGHPTAEQLQKDYLDAGSEGLHHLATARKVTGEAIAKTLADHPELYVNAKSCLAVLPRSRDRLQRALTQLGRLYPHARFPAVTIAISRGKPVAIGDPSNGVQVGLEALCAADTLGGDAGDRFVHVLAHEYAHVQQSPALADDEHQTVLEASLIEGVAEFIAELTSGRVSNEHLPLWAKGRERMIEEQFLPDIDSTDLSRWLYNGRGTEEWAGDLGYWVGYRIAKAYYQHHKDKKKAIRAIIEMDDPKAFLAESGWSPGIHLQ